MYQTEDHIRFKIHEKQGFKLQSRSQFISIVDIAEQMRSMRLAIAIALTLKSLMLRPKS